jgi:hypothetical protein
MQDASDMSEDAPLTAPRGDLDAALADRLSRACLGTR